MITADNYARRGGRRPWIAGICADFSQRTGIPVWMWRLGAVFLLLCHALLALFVYVGLAIMRARRETHVNATMRCDTILSRMEEARLDREDKLRQAFRDLDRR